jgi:methyl-accepting chemotaxis protein
MKKIMRKDERRNYLINPKFQWSMVGIFIGISLIINIIYFISMSYSFNEFQAIGRELKLPPDGQFFKFINHQEGQFTKVFLWTSGISSVILVIFGVLLSHKIAGPIYRISEDLKSMIKDGKLKTVQFRKGDFFIEMTEIFNSFISSIKDKMK